MPDCSPFITVAKNKPGHENLLVAPPLQPNTPLPPLANPQTNEQTHLPPSLAPPRVSSPGPSDNVPKKKKLKESPREEGGVLGGIMKDMKSSLEEKKILYVIKLRFNDEFLQE